MGLQPLNSAEEYTQDMRVILAFVAGYEKRGSMKVVVSRAVRLLKCPLGELLLYNMADMVGGRQPDEEMKGFDSPKVELV